MTAYDLSSAHWRKSSRSDSHGEACVEIASLPGMIAIRDSKNPGGPKIVFTRTAFTRLTHQIRTGCQDL